MCSYRIPTEPWVTSILRTRSRRLTELRTFQGGGSFTSVFGTANPTTYSITSPRLRSPRRASKTVASPPNLVETRSGTPRMSKLPKSSTSTLICPYAGGSGLRSGV